MSITRILGVLATAVIVFLGVQVTVMSQQLLTVREVFNKVWDKANSRLMTTPWAGAQQVFETETTILNNVYDAQNLMLRVSGSGGAGSGDVVSNTTTSVDGEVVLFSGTDGKVVRRAVETGVAKVTAGVLSAGTVNLATEVAGNLPVTNLAGGSGAAATTFWRGDGAWAVPDTVGGSFSQQTGTSYNVVASDNNKLLFFVNVAPTTAVFPQANTLGFQSGSVFYLRAIGAYLTIDPTVSTINGQAAITIGPEDVATVRSDGTNYVATVTLGARYVTIECIADATTVTAGDGKCYFPVNQEMDGWRVFVVTGHVGAAVSSSGAVSVDVDRCSANATGIRCSSVNVSVLTTLLTIDVNESGSETAAVPAVVNVSNASLSVGQWLRVNVDGAGTNVQGLYVTVGVKRL